MTPSAFRLPTSDLGSAPPRLPFWLVAAVLLAAFGLAGHIDMQVELAEREAREGHHSSAHRVDLRDCTPVGIPVSPLVEFTIINHPDGPYAAGCTRFAATNTLPTTNVVTRAR
jgi:hypothetical protein